MYTLEEKNMQNEAAECFFTTFRPFALWFEKRSVYLQAKWDAISAATIMAW